MRINRDTLQRVVQETVTLRVHSDRAILAAYLCGSLLDEDYLLGGTTDIDLVFIHLDAPREAREIVRLNDEVHLDIAHHAQKQYLQPRQLRLDPWMGPTLYICKPIYDPQHFLDFVQASVRGQFDRPDYVMERVRPWANRARQIWVTHSMESEVDEIQKVHDYLEAVEKAVNAIAILAGPPLTERRFLLQLMRRTEALERPDLFAGVLGLLGSEKVDADVIRAWLPAWQQAYAAIPQPVGDHSLHASRLGYYQHAILAMLEMEPPLGALWPLISSWARISTELSPDSPHQAVWLDVRQQLSLTGAGLAERFEALDAYLDTVEEAIEGWARANGVAD